MVFFFPSPSPRVQSKTEGEPIAQLSRNSVSASELCGKPHHLWWFNVAIENGEFMADLPLQNGDFL